MEKKTKLRIFLVVPVLFGLAAVIFFGMARTNRDHGLPSRQVHVQALWAKEPSEGPAQQADTAKAAPPRLALQNPSELDAEGRRLRHPVLFLPPVAAKAVEHELDHVALAVMRRRHMGKDKQFHFGFAIYDIRFTRRANSGIVNRKL